MRLPRAAIAWLWTLLVFVLCWTPRQYVPEGQGRSTPFLFPHFDKLVHFLLFAGFSFLWLWAGPMKARVIFWTGVAAAILSELGQLTPIVGRDATWLDGAADVVGVGAGIVAYHLVRNRFVMSGRPAPARRRVR